MRLCLVVPSFGAGGAERVLATLANAWAARHDVTIVTLSSNQGDFYPLDRRVNRVGLDVMRDSTSIVAKVRWTAIRVRRLRAAISRAKPDVVLSFIDRTNVLVLMALVGSDIPVVVSERIHPESMQIGALENMLRRAVYPRADFLVMQTERSRGWANDHARPDRVRVIPNPIDGRFFDAPVNGPRERFVLGVGRLVPQKGFDVLIRAFARIRTDFADWRLAIAGDGADRAALADLANRLAPGRVDFLGPVARIEDVLRRAGVFALSSRFEGFPNALVEAMASGCAVVSTDCPTGPAEIIRRDETGLLTAIDDDGALAAALTTLLRDPGRRMTMGAAAARDVRRFRADAIAAEWLQLLQTAARAPAIGVRSTESSAA